MMSCTVLSVRWKKLSEKITSASSNALCAKAKAMYGYRLNEESYSDLCRKQTLGEMVTYLKSQTKYSDVLKLILLAK